MDSIILQTGDNTVTDGDVIGRLGFAASSETGTNARLVVAKIEAVAEEAFDASNNATEMVFYLAADGAAASKMTLTSAGNLNIGGELQTTNIGYTDGDNAIVIADGGSCTFPQDATFSGSIVAGTWQGTAIAHDYIGLDAIDGTNIADDAVNSEHYVDGSIDTAHIADDQVTYAKIQNVSATDRILGRDSSGAGVIEEITPANLRTMINVEDGATADQTKSDIDGLAITTVGTLAAGDATAIVSAASTTAAGKVELATTAETTTGTDTARAVTPDGLKDGYQGSTNVTTLGTIATGTWQGTAIAHAYIGNDAIDGDNIADDSVNSEHYVDGSIDTAHIADLQVTTGKIAADAITGAKIADDAVDSEHYVDLSIDTAHIGNLQVTTGKIANLAVETGKINNLAVESGKIANLAVTTGKIADDAVTDAKLAHAITVVTSLTAPLIEGTTSIQTPLIEYTDGDDAIAIADGGGVTLSQASPFSKAVKTPLKSNTDASTITFDLDEASTHTVTLGDNRTLAISNEDAGQKFIINLVQDGTGSRTVTWFSTIKWAGGSAPTLTTTANKADSFGFLCTGTDAYYGFVIGQNI